LKDDPQTREIPVILLTAHGAGDPPAGVDVRLGTPFQIDEVDAAIRRLVG
jgi:CheY-like chemotaxis protein